MVLGFELMALGFLSKCSTTWTMPPALFALVVFQTRSWASSILPPRLASNLNPPNLCLQSSWNYRHELPRPACELLQLYTASILNKLNFSGPGLWAHAEYVAAR
jgi:hypothetical protein